MRAEPFQVRNFINGQFVEPVSGKYLDNVEPATGKPYSQVADSDAHDVDLAVAAAEKAFCDWSQTPATADPHQLITLLGTRPAPGLILAIGPGWNPAAVPHDIAQPADLAQATHLTRAIVGATSSG